MKFRAVFLDIDDTLFDFRKSSFEALVTAFAEIGVSFTEADMPHYEVYNNRMWEMFERGEIEKEHIYEERFRLYFAERGIEADTAATMADMMARNVTETYGAGRFPNMDICAKSGTAEVGGGKAPNSWFTGFLRNEDAPYAFAVVVEEGGSGAQTAGNIAASVLDLLVNGY